MATSVWQLYSDNLDERRGSARRSVAVTRASVHGTGGADEATLLDLSIYGCRLAVGDRHGADDRLWLRFDGGWTIAATVVWTDGERMGCRFDEPIAGSLMRALSRALF